MGNNNGHENKNIEKVKNETQTIKEPILDAKEEELIKPFKYHYDQLTLEMKKQFLEFLKKSEPQNISSSGIYWSQSRYDGWSDESYSYYFYPNGTCKLIYSSTYDRDLSQDETYLGIYFLKRK